LQDFLADEAKLRRRLVAAAAANLLLSPFLLLFLVIYFFMKHAEKFYHSPGARTLLLLPSLGWCNDPSLSMQLACTQGTFPAS
jgi:hypothetical protein